MAENDPGAVPSTSRPLPPAPGQEGAAASGAAPKITNPRLAALVGEDFDVMASIGGVRGLVESVAPGLVFVVVFVATGQAMVPALIAALATAAAATVVRLVQHTAITQALSGLLGVAIGVVWALWTGKAQDFFAGGLLANAGYAVAFALSIVVRWPLVGVIAGLLRSQGTQWREDRPFYRRAVWVTWLWAAMFVLRIAVQWPLYLWGEVAWLGTAKLVMGLPLFAVVGYVSWLALRAPKHLPAADGPPAS